MSVKGFTLIETLFAFSVVTLVYLSLVSLIIQEYYLSNHFTIFNKIESYEELLDDQFYPVTDLESTLEEIFEDD